MSTKRLAVSTLWLAIGGMFGAALLWWPWFTTVHSAWWIVALLVIAFAFNASPNWWANTSGFVYFVACWIIGGATVWVWGIGSEWLSITSPGDPWLELLAFPLIGLIAAGWILADYYLPLEFYYNPEQFGSQCRRDHQMLWRSTLLESVVVKVMTGIIVLVWATLLTPLNHFIQSSTADRVLYALLFAWVMVWLGKLAATLKARANPVSDTLLRPEYSDALKTGERWDRAIQRIPHNELYQPPSTRS